jgi:4-diphosphocytidyl-2-C-methyl-D-erythritol kinase
LRLRALAPAKVNLSLFLGGVRSDGRHELVTLVEPISLADELTLGWRETGPDDVICPGVEGPNLAAAALAELRSGGWDAPPVSIEIRKRIPVAAGLGGGSADAACALRLAACVKPLPAELDLGALASRLGADVPSQLQPGLLLGTGAGDLVSPRAALSPHAFVIVPSSLPLSTATVYAEADRLGLPRSEALLADRRAALEAALASPGAQLPVELLSNDLAAAAISLHPDIDAALAAVLAVGAEREFVCGSGPTAAGIFWGGDATERAVAAATALIDRFPGAVAAAPVAPEYGFPQSA